MRGSDSHKIRKQTTETGNRAMSVCLCVCVSQSWEPKTSMKDENYTENSEPDAADMFHILLKLGSQSAQAKLKHTRRTCASHSVAHVGVALRVQELLHPSLLTKPAKLQMHARLTPKARKVQTQKFGIPTL